MEKLKSISLFDIEIFLKVTEKKVLKTIISPNYDIKKETDDSFTIKIPNLKFQEKKTVPLLIQLQTEQIPQKNQLNLLKGYNFLKIIKFIL